MTFIESGRVPFVPSTKTTLNSPKLQMMNNEACTYLFVGRELTPRDIISFL